MQRDQVASLLSKTSIFQQLDQRALEALAERAVDRSYRKGQAIFHEGDPGDAMFVLSEGLVKILVTSEDGDEMVLATLKAPDLFGEITLIDGGVRSATVEALEPTRVLAITRDTFLQVLRDNPGVTDPLLRSLGAYIRRLTERASDLVFLGLNERIAKLLLQFAEESGSEDPSGIVLDLALTQSDLARMVGSSRQSMNQVLRAFERRGYIQVQGKQILLRDRSSLQRLAGASR